MTIGGALSDLNNLLKADDIPFYYKPSIKAVIDTIALSCSENPNNCDLISRQSAIFLASDLKQDLPDDERISDMVMAHNDGILEYQTQLSLLSSVKQEQKIGYWIKHDTGHSIYYDCSLCGCAAPCTETADKILWKMANYCPDCGAKMENNGNWE